MMEMSMSSAQLIPHIWAETLLGSLHTRLILDAEQAAAWQEQHERRLREDPAYALRWAEAEAESYWVALYDNQRLTQEEDDEW